MDDNSPLGEGPGEGYHRQTHPTLSRAQAAKGPWALTPQRHKQSLDRCKDFLSMKPLRGQQIFRHEWQNFKRVLQPTIKIEF